MPGDASQDVCEPSLRIDVIHLGSDDQAVEDRRALTAAIRAAEQPRLAAQGDAAQRALGGVVAEADAAIVEEADERGPAPQHVVDGLGQIVSAGELVARLVQPSLQFGDEGLAARLPKGLRLIHLKPSWRVTVATSIAPPTVLAPGKNFVKPIVVSTR